ncbi:MAG: glycosyltransferase [Clostridia bacterium]|nr:glycosyltransferase [Clostridia bacterium]
MKILVLSANTGQGHNSAGRAIIQEAESRGITGVMMDSLLFQSPRSSRYVEKIHINSALYAPKLIGVGNRLAYKITKPGSRSIAYYLNARNADCIYALMVENGFDTVIATHVFAAEALTSLREKHTDFRSYFVVTDYSVTPLVDETALDAYFIPHKDFVIQYENRAPGKRYIPTGIPVMAGKTEKLTMEKARKQLGLPLDAGIIMLMTGSMGFGNIQDIIRILLQNAPKNTVFLAFCGTNKRLRKSLDTNFGKEKRLRTFGFIHGIEQYYDAADVLISKPGGLSSTEAAVREIPFVQIAPMPGWEEDNVRFFGEKGMAKSGKMPEEIAEAVLSLLTDKEMASAMRACQHLQINKNAASQILDYITNCNEE